MALVAITRSALHSAGAACGFGRHLEREAGPPLTGVSDGAGRALASPRGATCWHGPAALRDWVHRYNAQGVEGLRDAPRSGRPLALSKEQMQELTKLVVSGPDLAEDGVVRWRCVDLQEQIETRFGVEMHERTVSKLLRRLRITRLQLRPFHPKQDLAAQEAYKKTSQRV